MQLATMLEPALISPSPAPVRRLSSVMRRLVRWADGWLGGKEGVRGERGEKEKLRQPCN